MQSIDISVSKAKFEAELDTFMTAEKFHRERGVLLLQATFPDMIFIFCARQLKPIPIVFAVRINFDNYDLEPLSVKFIDPFTRETLPTIPIPMIRKIVHKDRPPELFALAQQDNSGLPFICLPGIREYHNHPAHTGDLWLLHRNIGGEGTLGFLIDKLYEYGISAITTFQFQAQLQLQIPQALIAYNPNTIPQ